MPARQRWRSRFNSIVVRLKDGSLDLNLLGRYSFNSIVVRLKVNLPKGEYDGMPQFQFHSGSIKSEQTAPRDAFSSLVSIP